VLLRQGRDLQRKGLLGRQVEGFVSLLMEDEDRSDEKEKLGGTDLDRREALVVGFKACKLGQADSFSITHSFCSLNRRDMSIIR
jgi:hypothetical protein